MAATAADQIAFEAMTRTSVAEIARYLQELFGQKLTALMVGVQNPKAVGQWARGEREPHPQAARRLRDAFHVAKLLMQVESAPTVQSWFMGMNPQLDDETPALLIASRPADVLRAARAFAAIG